MASVDEIPGDVIAGAVVNATAHRDYSSNAGIQVMVFSDRIEIWNPGQLPSGLTPEWLRIPHSSIPKNPLIADPLFLAHYIEKAGTGTLDMIRVCHETGLPEPEFEQRGNQFVVTLWRDWLTDEVSGGYNLNERQKQAIKHVKITGSINNATYRDLNGTSERTAARELRELSDLKIFARVGSTGQAVYYVIAKAKHITVKGE